MMLALLILSMPIAFGAAGIVSFLEYGLLVSIATYSLTASASVLLMGIALAVRQRPSDREQDRETEHSRIVTASPQIAH